MTREILALVKQINASMKHRIMSGAAQMGFSATQFLVMYELTQAGSITMHDLQKKCDLPKSTMSRAVDQLVKRGVVKRERPENNRRVVMLAITDTYTREKAKLKQSVAEKISGRLSPKRAFIIKQSLEELAEIVKIDEKEEV
jgi:DNA-binding MarR family transcriptional regulator